MITNIMALPPDCTILPLTEVKKDAVNPNIIPSAIHTAYTSNSIYSNNSYITQNIIVMNIVIILYCFFWSVFKWRLSESIGLNNAKLNIAQNTNIFNKVSALNLSTTHTQKNNTIEDVQNHGLGLKSVSRIISNYNGTIKCIMIVPRKYSIRLFFWIMLSSCSTCIYLIVWKKGLWNKSFISADSLV